MMDFQAQGFGMHMCAGTVWCFCRVVHGDSDFGLQLYAFLSQYQQRMTIQDSHPPTR